MNLMVTSAALILSSVTIVSPLAGALEGPGGVRLSRAHFVVLGQVYYPGFTLQGLAEPLAVLAIAIFLTSLPLGTAAFRLAAFALLAEAAAHSLYWALIVPMNGVWLAGVPSSPLQDRWERAHVGRSVASTAAFVLLVASRLASAG
jgi:hypothetical protein